MVRIKICGITNIEDALLSVDLGANALGFIFYKGSKDPKEIESYPTQAILFDNYSTEAYGGTGETFGWEILRGFDTSKKIILSGGLTPENVAQAVKIVNPYAVDVSSGVEENPGKKNPDKLKRFIKAVRNET